MPDYTIAQRTTVPIQMQFEDADGIAIPIPAKFTAAKAALGLTEKTSTADDVALTVDLTRREEGIAEVVLTPEVTGAMKPDQEYTLDCLFSSADESDRERPMKITIMADRTRTP